MITWLAVTSWIWGWLCTVILRMSIDDFRSVLTDQVSHSDEQLIYALATDNTYFKKSTMEEIIEYGELDPDDIIFAIIWPLFFLCAPTRLRNLRMKRIENHNTYVRERTERQERNREQARSNQHVPPPRIEVIPPSGIFNPTPKQPLLQEPINIEEKSILQTILEANKNSL